MSNLLMRNAVVTLTTILSIGCGGDPTGDRIDTKTAVPAARWGHAMAYDEQNQNVVMFGGSTNSALFNDTWTWDGTQWKERAVSGVKPTPRDQQIMTYDPVGKRVLLYGGRTSLTDASPNRELWSWNGSQWTLLNSDGPAMHGHESGGWDSARNRFVVVAIVGDGPAGTIAETWEWDGSAWARRATATPSSRTLPSRGTMYATSANALFMLAGNLSTNTTDMWSWNGTAWTATATELAIAPPSLVSRTDTGGEMLVLDESRTPTGTTWTGTNGTLTKQSYTGPTQRFVSWMTYDAAHHNVVLFGGQGPGSVFLNDTWIWNSSGWNNVQ